MKGKKKIGIVCYPTFGGSGVVATELGKALAERGHEVHFITYNEPVRLGSFSKNIFYHEVRVSEYPLFDYPPYELVLTSKLVDVVKYEKLDLLHVHYAIPHASAAYNAQHILACEGINIPYITTLHGTDITLVGKDPSFEPVITFAINQSNGVTAVSQSLKDDTFEHFNINREIEVIPNFVNLDKIELKWEEKHGLKKSYAPNGEFILSHISNFRKVKRIPDILKIFEIVRREVPVKLLLVGDGPERMHIRNQCEQLGICEDVIMTGKLKSPDEILSISDLFLLTSENESFGLAALEAMAYHVPVISSNTGGIPEVNEQGYSGFLSDVGDVEDMAKNALSLLKNPEKLELFKKQARKKAEEFDINKILPLYIDFYNKILAENKLKTVK
jgi:N-acetyl-alpha-D-glucosaminyl L-malate synthase BshA